MRLPRPLLPALVAVAALIVTFRGAPREQAASSLPLRLLGPVSSLAAGWQWVRVRLALDAGLRDLAYSRAELALELDPSATEAWAYLASNMAFDRASPYRQARPELRTRWTEIALELLRRGERTARRPAELAWQAGLILIRVGDSAGAVPWPGGAGAAWSAAAQHFERATRLDPGWAEGWVQRAAHQSLRLGSPELAPSARERLEALRAALALLDEGQAQARQTAPLEFERGLLLGLFGDGEDAQLWPGGRAALYRAAIAAFEVAERAHHPLAAEARRSAQQALEALGD
jgi:hypothetical protein